MRGITINKVQKFNDEGWADDIWKEGWAYIKTVTTTVREPLLILDKKLCVLAANQSFYQLFHATPADLEYKYINDIGREVWNVPALEALFKVIVPRNSFFSGFEVNHAVPSLGKRIMVLNSRSMYKAGKIVDIFPPIIILATGDVNEMTAIAEAFGYYAAEIERDVMERTKKLEVRVGQIKKEVELLHIDPKYLL
jgi:two-component system CheB/CheR fusion protein